jgi:hypothetical protein
MLLPGDVCLKGHPNPLRYLPLEEVKDGPLSPQVLTQRLRYLRVWLWPLCPQRHRNVREWERNALMSLWLLE